MTKRAADTYRTATKLEKALHLAMCEALSRTLHLRDMNSSDVARIMPNWRSGQVAAIRTGKIDEFGTSKLAYATEKLDVTAIAHFIPPPAKPGSDAPEHRELFRALRVAADACGAALPDVGERTYPLARVATESARLGCYLAVEAVRRNRHFADREAEEFALQLVSASRLLNRIKFKTPAVRRAIERLEDACDALDGFGAESAISDERETQAA